MSPSPEHITREHDPRTLRWSEVTLVYLPLLCTLGFTWYSESTTGLILNVLVHPALLYFLIVATLVGSSRWWHYPLGLLTVFACLYVVGSFYAHFAGRPPGGVAVLKLGAVVGAALGVIDGIQFAAIFLVLVGVVLILDVRNVPAASLMMASLLTVFILNYFRSDLERDST